jgi:hypothetical protein
MLVVDLYPAVPICIDTKILSAMQKVRAQSENLPLERFRKSFDYYAGSYESVESYSWRRAVASGCRG